MPPKRLKRSTSDLAYYTAKLKEAHPTVKLSGPTGEPFEDPRAEAPEPELSDKERSEQSLVEFLG